MVHKEPSKAKNRLTGMKQVEKTKKKKIEVPKEASRKSTRQSTVEQREKDEEYVEPKRKKYTRKVHKQLSQVRLIKVSTLIIICFFIIGSTIFLVGTTTQSCHENGRNKSFAVNRLSKRRGTA